MVMQVLKGAIASRAELDRSTRLHAPAATADGLCQLLPAPPLFRHLRTQNHELGGAALCGLCLCMALHAVRGVFLPTLADVFASFACWSSMSLMRTDAMDCVSARSFEVAAIAEQGGTTSVNVGAKVDWWEGADGAVLLSHQVHNVVLQRVIAVRRSGLHVT